MADEVNYAGGLNFSDLASKAQTIVDVLGEQGFARSLTKGDLEYLFAED